MKRIGIAASRIAKDDLVLYNIFVLILSFLLSSLIFLVSAFSIVVGVALVSYLTRGFVVMDLSTGLFKVAFVTLVVFIGVINLVSVLINIKLKR